jgi:hypothetical protein
MEGNLPSRQRSVGRPVEVDLVAYAPTVFFHCGHCEFLWQQSGLGDSVHRDEARQALPSDLYDEFERLSEWVHALWLRHGRRIHVRVVDAASIEGVWTALRHGLWRFPAVVVDGRAVRVGPDLEPVDNLIDRRVAAALAR